MTDEIQTNAHEVAVIDAPNGTKARIEFISSKRKHIIQMLAQKSKMAKSIPDLTVEPNKSLYQQLCLLLRWMDEDVEISSEIRDKTQIDKGLKLIFDTPQFHFPEAEKMKAELLYTKWESENWGANEVVEDDIEPDVKEDDTESSEGPAPKRRRKSTARRQDDADGGVTTLRLPPLDHPIFGKEGIMHGVAIKKNRRRAEVLDPRFSRKHSKVYGHNGLPVGTWFATRMVALFRGAHGATQGGIYGNRETGAYSIVISGEYDDLDQDYGNVLYYSGSNSHNNEDPSSSAPSSGGTIALQASERTRNPVRVIRTASGKSAFAPISGLRYDGLYRVVDSTHPKNSKGGLYEQFKLVRLDDQPEIDRSRPTKKENRDYGRIGDGY